VKNIQVQWKIYTFSQEIYNFSQKYTSSVKHAQVRIKKKVQSKYTSSVKNTQVQVNNTTHRRAIHQFAEQ